MSVVRSAGVGRIVLFFLICLALLLFVRRGHVTLELHSTSQPAPRPMAFHAYLFRAARGARSVGSLLWGVALLITRGFAILIGMHAAWNFGDWMRSSGGKAEGGI